MQSDRGHTLLELLVTVIIIGTLAAIALPSLLSAVNKGREVEGKVNTGTHKRAMQVFLLENYRFPTTVEELGVGSNLLYYRMLLRRDSAGVGAVGAIIAETQRPQLRSFVAVVLVPDAITREDRKNLTPDDVQTLTCQSVKPGAKVEPFFIREVNTNTFDCKYLRGEWEPMN